MSATQLNPREAKWVSMMVVGYRNLKCNLGWVGGVQIVIASGYFSALSQWQVLVGSEYKGVYANSRWAPRDAGIQRQYCRITLVGYGGSTKHDLA